MPGDAVPPKTVKTVCAIFQRTKTNQGNFRVNVLNVNNWALPT